MRGMRQPQSPRVGTALVPLVLAVALWWLSARADDAPPAGAPTAFGPVNFEKPPATLSGNTAEAQCVAYSPDGETLAAGAADKAVRLWDVRSGQLRNTLKGHNDVVA